MESNECFKAGKIYYMFMVWDFSGKKDMRDHLLLPQAHSHLKVKYSSHLK